MPKWEYLTLFLEASTRDKEVKEYVKRRFPAKKRIHRHAPESMIPDLNRLGAEGWELVHMEPVPKVGGNEDILFNAGEWSHHYFCVLKRLKEERPPVAPPPPPSLPNQDDPTPPVTG